MSNVAGFAERSMSSAREAAERIRDEMRRGLIEWWRGLLGDYRALFNTRLGRRVLAHIYIECGVYQDPALAARGQDGRVDPILHAQLVGQQQAALRIGARLAQSDEAIREEIGRLEQQRRDARQ